MPKEGGTCDKGSSVVKGGKVRLRPLRSGGKREEKKTLDTKQGQGVAQEGGVFGMHLTNTQGLKIKNPHSEEKRGARLWEVGPVEGHGGNGTPSQSSGEKWGGRGEDSVKEGGLEREGEGDGRERDWGGRWGRGRG